MKKKGQAEIVTTILLILIVLAAVVVVWQVINRFVKGSSETIETRYFCTEINLDIISADNNTGNISVTRRAGGENDAVKSVKILVDGEEGTISAPSDQSLTPLQTKKYTVNQAVGAMGKKIEVAVVLKDDSICDISDNELTKPA